MAFSALPDNLRLVLVMFFLTKCLTGNCCGIDYSNRYRDESIISCQRVCLRHLLLLESVGPVDAGLVLAGNFQANLVDYVRAAPGTR